MLLTTQYSALPGIMRVRLVAAPRATMSATNIAPELARARACPRRASVKLPGPSARASACARGASPRTHTRARQDHSQSTWPRTRTRARQGHSQSTRPRTHTRARQGHSQSTRPRTHTRAPPPVTSAKVASAKVTSAASSHIRRNQKVAWAVRPLAATTPPAAREALPRRARRARPAAGGINALLLATACWDTLILSFLFATSISVII